MNGDISKPKKRRLIEQLMADDSIKNMHAATDFASILVTTEELNVPKLIEAWKKVTLASESTAQPSQQGPTPAFVNEARNRNTYEVKPELKGSFFLREMIEYLRSKSSGALYQGHASVIQLLNVIIAKPPNENQLVKNIGSNKFYPFGSHQDKEAYDLKGGLEALRGYFSSVRPVVGRMLLNVNVTAGAFYKAMPLIGAASLLAEYGGSMEQSEAFIRMLKVKATYIKDGQKQPFMHKTKSIVGFAKPVNATKDHPAVQVKRFGNAKDVKFSFEDRTKPNATKQQVTVAEYFKRQHGITLNNPDQPVLNVGTRSDPQYLPMELCEVLPGQPYRRLLNGNQTTVMLAFAARAPNLNGMSIAGTPQAPGAGLKILRLADTPQSVKPFGLTVGTSMITVPGRILDAPQVKYGKKTVNPQGGSWNCAGQSFVKPGKFAQWKTLIINREGFRGELPSEQLVDKFDKEMRGYGIQMGQRDKTQTLLLGQFNVKNRDHNDRILEETFANAKRRGISIMLVIIPEVDKWLYARIKFPRRCDLRRCYNLLGWIQDPERKGTRHVLRQPRPQVQLEGWWHLAQRSQHCCGSY